MKALEKDRNRRYETANALARDVDRYLKDEPVAACPPSAWYRFRKFRGGTRRCWQWRGCSCYSSCRCDQVPAGWCATERPGKRPLLGEANRAISEARSLIARRQVARGPGGDRAHRSGRWPPPVATHALVPSGLLELDKDLAMARRLEEIHSQPGRQEPAREKQTGGSGAWRLAEHGSRTMTEEIFSGEELAVAYARAFRGLRHRHGGLAG